jgi:prepilin-type N-terminal cleavage/methylation domain-containing protein
MQMQKQSTTGMTLIEVLVVLVIVGVALFGFMPSITQIGEAGRDPVMDGINDLCADMADEALRMNSIQSAVFALGKKEIIWKKTEVLLPEAVSRVEVNGEIPSGIIFTFNVYPSGIMDEVRLELINGESLFSSALGGRFRRGEQ